MSDVCRKAVCLGLMPVIFAGLWAIASFNAVLSPRQVRVSPDVEASDSTITLTFADAASSQIEDVSHWMSPVDYVSIGDSSDVN